ETNDLAAAEPERIASMAAAWLAWAERTGLQAKDRARPAGETGSDKNDRQARETTAAAVSPSSPARAAPP
ncbi:MAG: hypothetical protein JXA90_17110, partial [Planctomycetes bacterium]|nr:hypothetical protein [Planctomycetota bacterium]